MEAIKDNSRVRDGANNVTETLPYIDAGIYVAGGLGIGLAGGAFIAAGAAGSALIGGAAAGLGFGTAFGGATAAAHHADECARNPDCRPEIDHGTVGMSAGLGAVLGPLAALLPTAGAVLGGGGSIVGGVDALGDALNGDFYTAGVNGVASLLGALATLQALRPGAGSTPKSSSGATPSEPVVIPTRAIEPIPPHPESARPINDILEAIKAVPTHGDTPKISVNGGPRRHLASVAREFLNDLPKPRGVRTNRPEEAPYQYPPTVKEGGTFVKDISPTNPLDVSTLKPDKVYLFTITEDGGICIAQELDPIFVKARERPVKHGDMGPARLENGELVHYTKGDMRGESRAAGELRVKVVPETGARDVEVNLGSSRTFANNDGINYLNDPSYQEGALGLLGLSLNGYAELTLYTGADNFGRIPFLDAIGFGRTGNGQPPKYDYLWRVGNRYHK